MKSGEKNKSIKFYWQGGINSGGTLSFSLDYEGMLSKEQKEILISYGLYDAYKNMSEKGYIPFNARLMSSSDIAQKHGNTRQYWEKLLNEGKILYKETSAGRITTDLWVEGYLGNREVVNKYVRNVRAALKAVNELGKSSGRVHCPVCDESNFQYFLNNNNVNGICRNCKFHVHATN